MRKSIFGKLIAVTFCVIVIACMLLTLTACEDDRIGDFYYRVKDDNTVAVYVEEYNMEELVIPDTIAGLKVSTVMKPKKAQKVNTTLTNVVLPETITSIDKEAFQGCSALESVNFPVHVMSINENAFKNCSSLKSIDLPEYLTTINHSAFENCSTLETVWIPHGVTTLGYDVFSGCISLKTAYIPSTVSSMGGRVFNGCPELEIWIAMDKAPWHWGAWAGIAENKIHWNYDGYNN